MMDGLMASAVPLDPFLIGALIVAVGMLIWDTVEVGRNDAANLVNAVYGARILDRRAAVLVAGIGVVVGAATSSGVIDTARKEIFDPTVLNVYEVLTVFISVYIVDTVLLYSYSAYGMPVSTTACLVFEIMGAASAIGGLGIVKWPMAGKVVTAILVSILISGIFGFMFQRIVRGAIRDRCQDLDTLRLHGGWVGGAMLTALFYFMIVKGMKDVYIVKAMNTFLADRYDTYGLPLILTLTAAVWAIFALLIHLILISYGRAAARRLFPVLAIIGMISMGFAFGQNDLANCASPGLACWNIVRYGGVAQGTRMDIHWSMLLGCGFLLLLGMTTKNAQRVTSAQVNTGSMTGNVALYAPRWCIRLARMMIRKGRRAEVLAPPPARTAQGERLHYDALRACVILGVSASVIATASSLGLPVSTTYVAFAAVIATGAADRILQRGDADLKLARTIWVVFSWFASAAIAAMGAGIVSRIVFHLGLAGLIICLLINMFVRFILKRRADVQDERTRQLAKERMYPERYAEYEG